MFRAHFQVFLGVASAIGFVVGCSRTAGVVAQPHTGICDASAAAAIDSGLFAVATDEDNTIRVYKRDHAGPPVQTFDLSGSLELDRTSSEADIEGAAKLGERLYWITSHGRDFGKRRF